MLLLRIICPLKRRTYDKQLIMIRRSVAKLDNALDIQTLVKTQKRLKALENVIFNSQQRVLHRMNRWNYLREDSSTSSC